MPKALARTWLEVLCVRVERLQAIRTVTDIPREGIDCRGLSAQQLRGRFRVLWDSLNAARGYPWTSNPWVQVVAFKRTEPPNGQA